MASKKAKGSGKAAGPGGGAEQPPGHLSATSRELWSTLVPSRVRGAGALAMLRVALEARDRADAAAAVVAKEGMTTGQGKGKVRHVHPLMKVEADNRRTFAKIWTAMRLHFIRPGEVEAPR